MEKIKRIITARRTFEADTGQYWVKSQRGRSYELWDERNELRRVFRIPAKRVFWVTPEEKEG